MADIWSEVLGVPRVGRKDRFFELGGDSLRAVTLFVKIREKLGKKLPLSTLFGAPTVEELTRVVTEEPDRSEPLSSLVAIQPAGSRPPFFCVHGGGGTVLIYRSLARSLGFDQPFYGLQSQGLDGQRPPLTRIEDMAALFVNEIRKVQRHGPYYLGGYCMGGLVAFEMAQQLKSQGEEVALVALLDTVNFSNLIRNKIRHKAFHQVERLIFHARNFALLDFREKVEFFLGKLDSLRDRIPVWRGTLVGKIARKRSERSTHRSESSVLASIWAINDRAALNYVPRPYPGVITEFRPAKQYARYGASNSSWNELAVGGHEVVTLPVYPAGMLVDPFVKHLAETLRLAIDAPTRRR
jgi:phthiocerol/phenolphthiocerol synthesis type-I polyketide synthase E